MKARLLVTLTVVLLCLSLANAVSQSLQDATVSAPSSDNCYSPVSIAAIETKLKEINPGYPLIGDTLWFIADDSLRVFDVTSGTKEHDLQVAAQKIIFGELKPRYDLPAKPYNSPKYKYTRQQAFKKVVFWGVIIVIASSIFWLLITARAVGNQRLRDRESKEEDRLSVSRLKPIGATCLDLTIGAPSDNETALGFLEQIKALLRLFGHKPSSIRLIQLGILESVSPLSNKLRVSVKGTYLNNNDGLEMAHEPLLLRLPLIVCRVELEVASLVFLKTGHYLMTAGTGVSPQEVKGNGLPRTTRLIVKWEMTPDGQIVEYNLSDIIIPATASSFVSFAGAPADNVAPNHSGDDRQVDTAVDQPRAISLRFREHQGDKILTDVTGSVELPDGIEAHLVTFDAKGKTVSLKTVRQTPAST